MVIATIAALLLAKPPAADFFPLAEGTKWSYESTGGIVGTYDQQVGTPIEVAGQTVCPIITIERGKISQQSFYEVTNSSVSVLGTDPKKPFSKPQPVFQIGERGAKWDFVGDSPYEDDKSAKIHIIGQSKMVGARDILGMRRDCLEVKTENRIGLSESTATVYKQAAIYGKGIGLVELQETIQAGKTTIKRVVRLIKFTPAGAGDQ